MPERSKQRADINPSVSGRPGPAIVRGLQVDLHARSRFWRSEGTVLPAKHRYSYFFNRIGQEPTSHLTAIICDREYNELTAHARRGLSPRTVELRAV